jgi:hypothetical protein
MAEGGRTVAEGKFFTAWAEKKIVAEAKFVGHSSAISPLEFRNSCGFGFGAAQSFSQ